MLTFPGDIAKVTASLTGFSPAVMVSRSCWNWSLVTNPDCLVTLEDAICEGILVLALDFC